MTPAEVLVLGTAVPPVEELTSALDGRLEAVPDDSAGLEAWRGEVVGGTPVNAVVVAVWASSTGGGTVLSTDAATWRARAEQPLAGWVAALGAATRRCADEGVIVAVVERPAALDCAGWGPEAAVADAVEALVRSLARSEGERGVRVCAVTTPTRITSPPVVAPAPPLASFPGTVSHEVAGAVRLLLDGAAAGLTGAVLHADCGRSWR